MMDYRLILLALCLPCFIVLPVSVHQTDGWWDAPRPPSVWVGAIGILLCVAVLEGGGRSAGALWAEEVRRHPPDWVGVKQSPVDPCRIATVVLTKLMTLMTYATCLDGGCRFAAARWVYSALLASAVAVLAVRWRGPFARFYLRWGWAPLLAFGVPVALDVLRAAGLIRGPVG